MNWLVNAIIAFAIAWAGAQEAHAIKLPAVSTGAAVAQAGKSSTVAIGGAGNTAVRSPAPANELEKVLGNRPYSAAGSPGAEDFARLSQKGRVPVADKEVPASISAPVAREAVIGGAVGLITGGVPGAVIGAGTPLLLDWMNRAGVRQNPQTGAPEEADPNVCSVAPCYEYSLNSSGVSVGYFTTRIGACEAWGNAYNAFPGGNYFLSSPDVSSGTCVHVAKARSNGSDQGKTNINFITRGVPPTTGTWRTATSQAIRDKLYNVGKPSTAIIKEILEQGGDVAVGPTAVTGPSEVAGDKRVKTLSDGSKVEEQDTIRYGYDGGKVTELGRRTTTTNISPTGERTPAGTTDTTSGESEPTKAPESDGSKEPELPPTDTPLPPVPDLYVRKYPNGMEGIYNEYKDRLKGTPVAQLAKQLMPNIGDGGTCPSWPFNLNLEVWALYGVHDVAPPCWIWAVGKAILILSALLLARSLIFGG